MTGGSLTAQGAFEDVENEGTADVAEVLQDTSAPSHRRFWEMQLFSQSV